MVFIVIPLRYIIQKVAIMEVGIDTQMIKAVLKLLKKIKRITNEIRAAWKAVSTTLLIDVLI